MRSLAAKKHLLPLILLSLILIGAAFFRLWNFTDTLLFQADQGRDALIVADLFRKGDLVFIGPVTSIGNMYLGPFYYYFMLPFLMVTYPSPIGPALAIALSSILTTFLLYYLGKEIVGKRAGILAAFFFAFSAEIVRYSRFSWNPNLTPLVSLILFWATFRAWKRNPWYWLVVAVCFSILIQLHYMTLLVAGGFGIIWLLQLFTLIKLKNSAQLKKLILASLGGVLIFLASLTPLVLFDLRHEGINRKGLASIFEQEQAFNPQHEDDFESTTLGTGTELVSDFVMRSKLVLMENIVTQDEALEILLLIGLVIGVAISVRKKQKSALIMFAAFIIPSLIGMSLYQTNLYVHYVIFLYPLVFLFYGWLLAQASRVGWGRVLVLGILIVYLSFNIPRMPLTGNGWDIYDMQALSEELITHLRPGEKYNIVLVSPTRDIYGPHYRYFLSTTEHPSLPSERGPEADTLVVINEAGETDLASLPIYEIVIFPVKIPNEVYTIPNGPEISIFRKTP